MERGEREGRGWLEVKSKANLVLCALCQSLLEPSSVLFLARIEFINYSGINMLFSAKLNHAWKLDLINILQKQFCGLCVIYCLSK